MKVKILRIGKTTVTTKYGEKDKLILDIEGHKECKTCSGFANATTRDWKVNDTVDIEIFRSGDYWNFKAKSAMVSREEFDALVKRVNDLELRMGPPLGDGVQEYKPPVIRQEFDPDTVTQPEPKPTPVGVEPHADEPPPIEEDDTLPF